MKRERVSWALLSHDYFVLVHQFPQTLPFCHVGAWFSHPALCSVDSSNELRSSPGGAAARLDVLLLHLGSGWVFAEKNCHSQHSQTWAMQLCCCQQTQPSTGDFMIKSGLLLPLLFQPRGCCLRNWPHRFLILSSNRGSWGTWVHSTGCCKSWAAWWAHPTWNLQAARPCMPKSAPCVKDHELPWWSQKT